MNQHTSVLDIFLCHTGANKGWVRALAERLEEETVDNRPLSVFFDEWDIAPGENILSKIEEGLNRARFVAIALSPALTTAAWPTMEWQSQVYDDPTGKRGRIIPLIVEKVDPISQRPLNIPLPLRLLRYIDFSRQSHFERSFRFLLARIRGDNPSRRRTPAMVDRIAALNPTAGPDAPALVDETVLGNLFQARLPERVFSDLSNTTSSADIWKCQSRKNHSHSPFVLNEHRLYSFVPYGNRGNPFRQFLTGTDRRSDLVSDVLKDTKRRNLLLWLCNDALRQHCYALRLRTPPRERHRYYPVISEGETRYFSWGRGSKLTLAKITGGSRPLGVHHAARMRFIEIAGRLHLLVQPCYFFTTDGKNRVSARKAGRYSVRWGGREGNRTVLRRTLMWPRILSEGSDEIMLPTGGPEPIRIATTPRYGRCNQGILGDSIDLQHLLEADSVCDVLTEADDLDAIASEYRSHPMVPSVGEHPAADAEELEREAPISTVSKRDDQSELDF